MGRTISGEKTHEQKPGGGKGQVQWRVTGDLRPMGDRHTGGGRVARVAIRPPMSRNVGFGGGSRVCAEPHRSHAVE